MTKEADMADPATSTTKRIKGGSFLIESRAREEVFTPEDMTDEHRLIAQTAQEFVDREIVPRLADIEEKKPGLLRELLKKAAELGLCATDVPQRFAGWSSTRYLPSLWRKGWRAMVPGPPRWERRLESAFCPLRSLARKNRKQSTCPNSPVP